MKIPFLLTIMVKASSTGLNRVTAYQEIEEPICLSVHSNCHFYYPLISNEHFYTLLVLFDITVK